MSIGSEADWTGLREAGRITKLTLDELERRIGPGITTAELDAIASNLFAVHGARSAPALAYDVPANVLISINDEIVHGIPGPRRIVPGDVVKIDVTVEKNGYIADAARTVLVGPASDLSRNLAACVRAAFEAALAIATAGTRVNEIGRVVSREVRRRGFTVVRGLSGHGVGRAIHEPPDVPNDYNRWQRDVLTEGLVITIEPMISAGAAGVIQDADGWTLRTSDGSLSAHHEHSMVITRHQPILLTA